ncbi:hypothetical protein PENSPDRAFT_693184 [Peniophora sp. CONT]|nr:hypothetical protein PENSPDRAFT_693184 [Peniophora sp. CONT]
MAPVAGPDGRVECHCAKICGTKGKRIKPGTWSKHNPSRSRRDPAVHEFLSSILSPNEREELASSGAPSSGTYFSSWPSRQAASRPSGSANGNAHRDRGFPGPIEDSDIQMDDTRLNGVLTGDQVTNDDDDDDDDGGDHLYTSSLFQTTASTSRLPVMPTLSHCYGLWQLFFNLEDERGHSSLKDTSDSYHDSW